MEHQPNDRESERPYYPSGFSPDVETGDTGYDDRYLAVERTHCGPIPSPEDLEYYSQILPDAPDRILRMAELNAQSFRDLNQRQIDGQITIERNRHEEVTTGQRSGLYAVGIMAAVAIVALLLNYPWVAMAVCTTTIIGVATVFVTGRQAKQDRGPENGDSTP